LNGTQTAAGEFIVPLAPQQAGELRNVSLLDEEAALGGSAAGRAIPEHRRDARLVAAGLEAFDAGPVGLLRHDEFAAGLDPGFENRSCLSVVHALPLEGKIHLVETIRSPCR
jgi:hypothetical protein